MRTLPPYFHHHHYHLHHQQQQQHRQHRHRQQQQEQQQNRNNITPNFPSLYTLHTYLWASVTLTVFFFWLYYSRTFYLTQNSRGVEFGVRIEDSWGSILAIAWRYWGKAARSSVRISDSPVNIWTCSFCCRPTKPLYFDCCFFILFIFYYKKFNFYIPISLIRSETLCFTLMSCFFVDPRL